MKLVNFSRQLKMEFHPGEAFYLIVESEKELRRIVGELRYSVQEQTDDWVLSEDEEILKKDQTAEMVFSPWMIDVNDRRIQKALFKQIEQMIQQESYGENLRDIMEDMRKLLNTVNEEMEYRFEYEIEDMLPLIKECEIHFEEEEDILLRLNQYIRLCAALLKKRLFVFVGLRQYLTPEEVDILVREAGYLDIAVLCIENTSDGTEKDMILIDKDLCRVV